MNKETQKFCEFCGLKENEVKCLVAVPTIFICNECIIACQRLVDRYYEVKTPGLEWFPIESAPKDGTKLLLYIGEGVEPFQVVGYFDKDNQDKFHGWVDVYDGIDLPLPTHYMPLPHPPKGDE